MLVMGMPGNTPVVFLHGFMGAPSDWLPVIKVLSQRYYCICPDLPGHGMSINTTAGLSPVRQIELLVDSIAANVSGSVHIVGYSLGGRIAMIIADKWPSLLRSLTLESAHTGLQSELAREQRKLADECWARDFNHVALPVVLEKWFSQAVYQSLSGDAKSCVIKAIIERATEMDNRISSHDSRLMFHRRMADALIAFSLSKQMDFSARLMNSAIPVFYISGELDKKYCELGEQLSEGSCSVQHHVFKQCGHNVHQQQPEAFAQLLASQLPF
ncbi:MAG: alpha/beta fold hydrolase [Hahellaceae bacterium]|nr:alpha/beta fold hydrolase [Hahellaceae bacterium]MCP5211397.1 alpha/beta fold hydrolase [Hahellaceae bacterium]